MRTFSRLFFPFAAFGAACVLGLFAVLLPLSRTPDPRGLQPILDLLEEHATARDLILLPPPARWSDLQNFQSPAMAVVGSSLPLEMARFDRIFVVRDGSSNVNTLQRNLNREASQLGEQHLGTTILTTWTPQVREEVILDLGAYLEHAQVTAFPRGETSQPCPWNGERFVCPNSAANWVGPILQTFDGEPHYCIWSHPLEQGELHIEFNDLPQATHVSGWYALSDDALDANDGSLVQLRLDTGVRSTTFRAYRQRGRRELLFPLVGDHTGKVRIVVSSARAGIRNFCWDLQLTRRVSE